jgi:hypothetical protein
MAAENARNNALYLMPETGGYATILDPTGAAALFIPTEDDNRIKDESKIITRAMKTGRNKRVSHRKGPGKASRNIRSLLHGLAASEGAAGTPAGALIWFEYLLRSFMPVASSHDASLVGVGSTAASVVTATNEMNIGDLMCLRGPVTNGGHAQWSRARNAASPILVDPDLAAAPAAADISYATRTYAPAVDPGESLNIADTFTLIEDQDDTHYAAPGGCVSALTLSADASGELMVDATIQCDERSRQNFAALPAAPVEDPEPIIFVASRVLVNDQELDVTNVAIELQVMFNELRTAKGPNGRGRPRIAGVHPIIRLDPLNDDDWEDLFNTNEVIENLLIEFGGDGLVEARLNSLAFHAEGVQIMQPPNETFDGDIVRKPLELGPCDVSATGYNRFYWQLGIV